MREIPLTNPEGVRFIPDRPRGVGVLTIAGSSGRIDVDRARLFAEHGALAESLRWFGGPHQPAGPWQIPLERFLDRVSALAGECDRIIVSGTSFGAEAALLTGCYSPLVSAVIAFAPSDVVWPGVMPDGRMVSHWSADGVPLPFVPLCGDWEPVEDPPSFLDLYRKSFADQVDVGRAAIPVETIARVLIIAGGDDRVWPSVEQATRISERRRIHGLATTVVTDPHAGHRTVLPGEPVVTGGARMARGGSEEADRRLGAAA